MQGKVYLLMVAADQPMKLGDVLVEWHIQVFGGVLFAQGHIRPSGHKRQSVGYGCVARCQLWNYVEEFLFFEMVKRGGDGGEEAI